MKAFRLRVLIKWCLAICLLLIVLSLLQLYLVLHPEHFFEHTLHHGQFEVYADQPINENIKSLLDEALERAKASEVYDANVTHKLVFAGDGLYAKLLGRDELVHAIGNCIISFGRLDVSRNRLVLPHAEMNFVYLLAHEAVHVSQHQHHGLFMNTPLDFGRHPGWKTEGYAEWLSQLPRLNQNPESLSKAVALLDANKDKQPFFWIDLGGGYAMPILYLRYRVLFEYLIGVRGMTYLEIIEQDLEPETIMQEVRDYLSQ